MRGDSLYKPPEGERQGRTPSFDEITQEAAYDGGVYGEMPDDGREVIRYCPWCGREIERDHALSGQCPYCYKMFAGEVAIEITKEAVVRFLEQFKLNAAMNAVAMYNAALKGKSWRNMSVAINAARDMLKEWGLFPDKQEVKISVDTVNMADADEAAKIHLKSRQGVGLLPGDTPDSQTSWWIENWYAENGYDLTIIPNAEAGAAAKALPAPELHAE